MDVYSRSRPSVGTQFGLLLVIATLAPVAAILGLGDWAINQITGAGVMISQTNYWIAVLVVAVVVGIVVAFSLWRMRAAARGRVNELTELCRQISMGNRQVRLPAAGDDEFAVLGATINSVLEGVPVSSPKGAGFEGQDAALLQAQIEKLLQEVSAVGDGDLRVQAEVTPDTLGVLADSFNYMIEELAKVVGRVQATTLQVTNATRRLLDRSAEVAQASEAQAQQIAQTSEAVGRLADFVQLSANNAILAAEAAKEAIHNAQEGRQAVVQTIDGMVHIRENVQETSKKIKRLGERSQEVGEIVRLIEDIADQTNLLALNAAIQSAMAGEHGRGFAVVADEIRVLAERVTEATKRIAAIVKSIQGDTYEAVVAMEESTQEVVNGSRLADDAGRALASINSAVDRQAQMIEGIARAASDRKQTAEAVAMAMSQIAEITRQTNTATQDTTTSISYLAELAEQLRASVATFRLPEQIAEAAGLMAPPSQGYLPGDPRVPSLGAPEWGGGFDALPALPEAPALPAMGAAAGRASEFGMAGGYGNYPSQFPPAAPMPPIPPSQPLPPDYGAPNFGQMGPMGQMDFGQMGPMGQMDFGQGGNGDQPQRQQGEYPDPSFFSGPLGEPPY